MGNAIVRLFLLKVCYFIVSFKQNLTNCGWCMKDRCGGCVQYKIPKDTDTQACQIYQQVQSRIKYATTSKSQWNGKSSCLK